MPTACCGHPDSAGKAASGDARGGRPRRSALHCAAPSSVRARPPSERRSRSRARCKRLRRTPAGTPWTCASSATRRPSRHSALINSRSAAEICASAPRMRATTTSRSRSTPAATPRACGSREGLSLSARARPRSQIAPDPAPASGAQRDPPSLPSLPPVRFLPDPSVCGQRIRARNTRDDAIESSTRAGACAGPPLTRAARATEARRPPGHRRCRPVEPQDRFTVDLDGVR